MGGHNMRNVARRQAYFFDFNLVRRDALGGPRALHGPAPVKDSACCLHAAPLSTLHLDPYPDQTISPEPIC
jgi:hypothetical protein